MDASSLDEAVTKVAGDLEKRFSDELLKIIKIRFSTDFMIIFSYIYDDRFGALASVMDTQNDPTSPSAIKPVVMQYVLSEINNAVASTSIVDGQLQLGFLSYDMFGYPTGPDKVDTDYLRLFFFYMEGVPGSYAFISDQFFSKYFVPGVSKELGRFGKGFMYPEESYNKMVAYRNGDSNMKNLPKLPSFSTLKSPASGWPPTRIFEDMKEPVNLIMNQYINEVSEMVLGGK